MEKYKEKRYTDCCQKVKENLDKVFNLYLDLINKKISWELFIEYQNTLMDTLYLEKKEELLLKKVLKNVRNGVDKSIDEVKLTHCIDKLQYYERNILIFGDFLCWTFYKNDFALIDEHIKKEKVGLNSVGSGIVAEIDLLKKINVPENPQFYIYNSISSFLRIGDVSIFDKTKFKIVGLGEIKSSVPKNNSMIVTMDMIVKNSNIYYPKEMNATTDNDKSFLTEDMISHLEKQVEEMKKSFNPKNANIKIDKEVPYFHFNDLEKLINDCDKNGVAYVRVSKDISYIAINNDYEGHVDFSKYIPKNEIENMFSKNPIKGQNRIIFSELIFLSYGNNIPYLYYPLSSDCMKKGLNQTICIAYTYNKIIEEFTKIGFQYVTKKKIPYLEKNDGKSIISIRLSAIDDFYINMLLDEISGLILLKTMVEKSKKESYVPRREIFVNVRNILFKN